MVYDLDFQNVSDREKIPKLKNIVLTNPSLPEAVSALFELYAIVRPAFSMDRFEENSSFYLFLDQIVEEHSDLRIGQLALQYKIVWKMLEDDYKEVIRLSEDALKILKDEDRMCVLGNLIFTYGIYLYRLRAGEHVFVKKLTLLK